jgi:hypothetical protein
MSEQDNEKAAEAQREWEHERDHYETAQAQSFKIPPAPSTPLEHLLSLLQIWLDDRDTPVFHIARKDLECIVATIDAEVAKQKLVNDPGAFKVQLFNSDGTAKTDPMAFTLPDQEDRQSVVITTAAIEKAQAKLTEARDRQAALKRIRSLVAQHIPAEVNLVDELIADRREAFKDEQREILKSRVAELMREISNQADFSIFHSRSFSVYEVTHPELPDQTFLTEDAAYAFAGDPEDTGYRVECHDFALTEQIEIVFEALSAFSGVPWRGK